MTKLFYLSTRKDRAAEADALSTTLKECGWQRTFAWSAVDAKNLDELSAVAVNDLQGVHDADVLVVLLPGGFGTHVEIGAALALGKPVILHAPNQKTLDTPYPCAFHYHPKVRLLISDPLDVDAIIARMND